MKFKSLPGSMFHISKESSEAHYQSIKKELFELQIYNLPFCPLPYEGLVLDIGANIGMFTYQAAVQQCNDVICFEPSTLCLPVLKRNIEKVIKPLMDRQRTISIIEKGLWSKQDTLIFYDHPIFSGCNRFDFHPDPGFIETKVETLTLDSVIEEINPKSIDFLKMDIEGAELEALKGSVNTIKKYKPKMAISTYHNPNDEKEIVDFIESLALSYSISTVFHHKINIKITYFYSKEKSND